jgi:hypothetical protein
VTSRISPARPFTAEISPGTAVSSLASWTPLSSCGFVENGALPRFPQPPQLRRRFCLLSGVH